MKTFNEYLVPLESENIFEVSNEEKEESKNKPILFINFGYDVENQEGVVTNLKTLIESKLFNSKFCAFSDIVIKNGLPFNINISLEDYGLIFVGPIGKKIKIFSIIKSFCDSKKIPILCYGSTPEQNNKVLQNYKLGLNNINQPKTYIGNPQKMNLKELSKELKFPIVSKILDGSGGEGVELHKDMTSLKEVCENSKNDFLIFQEFIPNDCDYRVFFLDNDFILSIKRSRKEKGEFRNNVSLGGVAERVVLQNSQLVMARKAHECMGFYASGVDLIQNQKTKEWFILEINSAPQFSVLNAEAVVNIFIKHIEKLLKK